MIWGSRVPAGYAAAGASARPSAERRNRWSAVDTRRHGSGRGQPADDAIERVGRANPGVCSTMNQLQQLGDELDIADPASPFLTSDLSSPSGSRRASISRFIERTLRRACSGSTSNSSGWSERERLRAEVQVSGNRAGLQECLLLPEPTFLAKILQVGRLWRDQRSCPPPGPLAACRLDRRTPWLTGPTARGSGAERSRCNVPHRHRRRTRGRCRSCS